jgi:hypothetical protein
MGEKEQPLRRILSSLGLRCPDSGNVKSECDGFTDSVAEKTSEVVDFLRDRVDTKGLMSIISLLLAFFLNFGAPPSTPSMAMAEPPPITHQYTGATATTNMIAEAGSKAAQADRGYVFITGFPFPLGPFFSRQTVETELVPGRVYGYEQEIKLSGITANVRSTVFRTRDNHLVVYNPVAPTKEFLKQLDALDHKGVSHILLGATTYEHKATVAPFARQFPDAKVWAVPNQWSYPLNLPAKDFGIDISTGGELTDTEKGSLAYSRAPDFLEEFEVKLLHPNERLGSAVGFNYAANEAALFHKDTKTLVVTDALINVPEKPTAIYDEQTMINIGDNTDSSSLGSIILKSAATVNWQGTGKQEVQQLYASDHQGSRAEQLQRGYERNVLFSLYFGPEASTIVRPEATFEKLAGKWNVAPVTDSLIYRSAKVKPELKRWVEDICKWDFQLISPSHFDAKPGTPEDVRKAFAQTLMDPKYQVRTADLKLLDDIADALEKTNVI